jgi:Tfp pilus assembly protein PilF
MRTLFFSTFLTLFLFGCASKETAKTTETGKSKNTSKEVKVDFLESGIDAYKARDYEKAKNYLTKAIKSKLSDDDMLTAHKHLAFIYALQGASDAAYKQFAKAFKTDKDFELDKSELGHPAWTPSFERAQKEAVLAYSKGTKLFGDGKKFYSKREYTKAIRMLEAAVTKEDLKPGKKAEAYKFLAFIYAIEKNPAQARAAFVNAFKLDKEFQLDKSEYGNPVWTPIYDEVQKQFQKK